MMPQAETALSPVVKTLTVGCSPAEAFRLFTEGLGSWWPLDKYSIGQANAVRCGCEGWVGGTLWEETAEGSRHPWGTILGWQPPERLVFTWHPGREASLAQQVEVSFVALAGGTRVELVHSGWEVLGPAAEETRAGYEGGWDVVFVGRFGDACGGERVAQG